jgi:diphthamide synthase (EF-2-diphthine--ammonia ligase)
MKETCERALSQGIEAIAFGDLFLEDIRAYRIAQMRETGLEPLFPVWGCPTHELARKMIAGGLRAKLTCVDTKQLPSEFVGREFNEELLSSLPAAVDPCGERGEFHTCVFAGPMFRKPIALEAGEIVMREQFAYADFKVSEPAKVRV